jgi:hypothetical protein
VIDGAFHLAAQVRLDGESDCAGDDVDRGLGYEADAGRRIECDTHGCEEAGDEVFSLAPALLERRRRGARIAALGGHVPGDANLAGPVAVVVEDDPVRLEKRLTSISSGVSRFVIFT